MRIAKLELLAFGHFRGLELDLSGPGIHLVFGRNEAGKSTTLRAIAGLLYGIDTRTRDAHLHRPQDLRIGGTLVGEDGERHRVVRRKGNTNTLLDDRGGPVDDAPVLRLLRGVTEETFKRAFALDHETLRVGGQALVEGKGDLGESLFDASVGGGGDVQRLLAELGAEADEIWRPRATSLPLNEALKAFAEAQKAVRDRQTLPEAHVAQEREIEQTKSDHADKVRARRELVAERGLVDRATKRIPRERRRASLAEERESLAPIAREASRVAAVVAGLADHERALAMRRDLFGELARAEARVEQAARQAGLPCAGGAVDVPEAMRLDTVRVGRIERLMRERLPLQARVAQTREQIESDARELEALSSDVAGPPPAEAQAALSRALDRARSLVDREARIAGDRSRAARRRKELEAKASALPFHDHALDALVSIPLPPAPAVDALVMRAGAIERTRARIADAIAKLDAEAAANARQLAEHSGAFAPPAASDLRDARARRDQAWLALRAAADDAERRALEAAVEGALRDVDAIADRMLAEADRVTLLARLASNREALAAERVELEADAREQNDVRAALDAELAALFAAARVSKAEPETMRAWLDKHAAIVESHAALLDAEHALAEDERAIEEGRRELAVATAKDPSSRLSELVGEASRRLAQIVEARQRVEETARTRARLEERLASRRSALGRDEAMLAEVERKLSALVTPLGLDEDSSDDEIRRMLDATRELCAAIDARQGVSAELAVVEASLSAFAGEVVAAAKAVAPELVDAPPALAARGLSERLERLRGIEREIAATDDALAELGDEPIPDEVAAIAAEPEAARRRLEELDLAIEAAHEDVDRLAKQLGGLERGLAEMRGDSNAADAAAQAQEALARVRVHVERWCRAKLGAVILSREIERYREENQGPLLRTASSLFARLTLGAFSGMKAGFDDRDRPALRLVRAGGAEIDVTALSEGTRDQLYLSLRLASLLRYAEIAAPMPLVLDDVLVHFDDERSQAALSVLAEVARKVQVLFFTHHARLVDLARAAVPADALVVHELASPSAATAQEALAFGVI